MCTLLVETFYQGKNLPEENRREFLRRIIRWTISFYHDFAMKQSFEKYQQSKSSRIKACWLEAQWKEFVWCKHWIVKEIGGFRACVQYVLSYSVSAVYGLLQRIYEQSQSHCFFDVWMS